MPIWTWAQRVAARLQLLSARTLFKKLDSIPPPPDCSGDGRRRGWRG